MKDIVSFVPIDHSFGQDFCICTGDDNSVTKGETATATATATASSPKQAVTGKISCCYDRPVYFPRQLFTRGDTCSLEYEELEDSISSLESFLSYTTDTTFYNSSSYDDSCNSSLNSISSSLEDQIAMEINHDSSRDRKWSTSSSTGSIPTLKSHSSLTSSSIASILEMSAHHDDIIDHDEHEHPNFTIENSNDRQRKLSSSSDDTNASKFASLDEYIQKERSVLLIQNSVRQFLLRKRQQKKSSIQLIQSAWRRHRNNAHQQHCNKEDNATRIIQAAVRRYLRNLSRKLSALQQRLEQIKEQTREEIQAIHKNAKLIKEQFFASKQHQQQEQSQQQQNQTTVDDKEIIAQCKVDMVKYKSLRMKYKIAISKQRKINMEYRNINIKLGKDRGMLEFKIQREEEQQTNLLKTYATMQKHVHTGKRRIHEVKKMTLKVLREKKHLQERIRAIYGNDDVIAIIEDVIQRVQQQQQDDSSSNNSASPFSLNRSTTL